MSDDELPVPPGMDGTCQMCARLKATIAALQAENAELRASIGERENKSAPPLAKTSPWDKAKEKRPVIRRPRT